MRAYSAARRRPTSRAVAAIAETQGEQVRRNAAKAKALAPPYGNFPYSMAMAPATFSFATSPESAA